MAQNDPIHHRPTGRSRPPRARPSVLLLDRSTTCSCARTDGRTDGIIRVRDGRQHPIRGVVRSMHVRASYRISVVCTYYVRSTRYRVCILLPRDGVRACVCTLGGRASDSGIHCMHQTDRRTERSGRCVGLGRSIGNAKRQSRHAAARSLSLVKKDWTSVQEQYALVAHVIGCRFHLHQASRLLRATPLSAGLAHSKLLQCLRAGHSNNCKLWS